MVDNKTVRGPQDRGRIALGEDYEVAYWTKRFGVSKARLTTAVNKVGNSALEVEQFLRL